MKYSKAVFFGDDRHACDSVHLPRNQAAIAIACDIGRP